MCHVSAVDSLVTSILKAYRQDRDLSLLDIADASGFSVDFLLRFEANPTASYFDCVAGSLLNAYGIQISADEYQANVIQHSCRFLQYSR